MCIGDEVVESDEVKQSYFIMPVPEGDKSVKLPEQGLTESDSSSSSLSSSLLSVK